MKKCSKYVKMTAIVLTMLLAFTACSTNDKKDDNSNKDVNLEQTVSQELLDNIAFKDKLEPVEENVIETMYGITKEQYSAAQVYMSTGATAEEIAIFRATSDENEDAIENALEMRVQDQKSIMQGYLPDEMAKLDNAIIETEEDYVILCITDDTANAQKIIDKYFN